MELAREVEIHTQPSNPRHLQALIYQAQWLRAIAGADRSKILATLQGRASEAPALSFFLSEARWQMANGRIGEAVEIVTPLVSLVKDPKEK